MKVTVKLFARYRELAGVESIEVELPKDSTGSDLLNHLVRQYPALNIMHKNARLAVNLEFRSLETVLLDGDEISYIAPVSGGS